MPNKNGQGPRSNSCGPRDGRGKGKGKGKGKSNTSGIGKKKGGKKGTC